MSEVAPSFDEADVRRRATRLLTAFFTEHPNLPQAVLDQAFGGLEHDPRPLIEPKGPAATLAVECASQLLAYGCTDNGRHSLAQLLEVIRNDFLGANPDPDYVELPRILNAPCARPSRQQELDYLDALLSDVRKRAARYAPLRGIARVRTKPAASPLFDARDEDYFVPLRHLSRRAEVARPSAAKDYPDILSAFAQGKVTQAAVLGAPGAGKTTTLMRHAADLARKAQSDVEAPLPLLIGLGDWRSDTEALESYVARKLPGVGTGLRALSQARRTILLLDGLNEIPTHQREKKAEQVRALLRTMEEDRTPVYVSCRSEDYREALDLGLDTLTLLPLTPPRIRDVLEHWFALLFGDAGRPRADRLFGQLTGDPRLLALYQQWVEAGEDETAFWCEPDAPQATQTAERIEAVLDWEGRWVWRQYMGDARSLLRLATNPFMLTMLVRVWLDQNETLPDNRGDLFARFVDTLLIREKLARLDANQRRVLPTPQGTQLLGGLAKLAWSLQTRRVAQEGAEGSDAGVLTVADRDEALASLGDESLLKKAQDATLVEGDREIRFRHQLLQEYFTALGLKQRLEIKELDASALWPPEQWWERSGWEESAVLLAGLYAEDCTPVIRWLAAAQPEVAAQCILESGAEIPGKAELLGDLHDVWLPRVTDAVSDPAPGARATSGRALGRLGLDDRKGVGLDARGIPDIDWVEIPAGDFVYQENDQRHLETFWISRFPITHAQFEAFIRDGGYQDKRWWRGLHEHIAKPEEPGWPISNHPREMVSWYEAMAFCTWLSEKLGSDVSLPSEEQWEKAARGTDGRTYPWGEDWQEGRANTREAGISRTTAVGIFPGGQSPYGIMDMAGNVWEWCLNEYYRPERTQRKGNEWRVLRGGSWVPYQDFARADYRYYYHPAYRAGLRGFRVVCASPHPL